MVHAPVAALVAAAIAAATPAFAEAIDLSKPWGNKDGCINKDGQEFYSETMLLLTSEALVTASSACAIEKTLENKDGSLTLTTSCESEGEASAQPAIFTVKPASDKLGIFDGDGNLFGEVSQCR